MTAKNPEQGILYFLIVTGTLFVGIVLVLFQSAVIHPAIVQHNASALLAYYSYHVTFVTPYMSSVFLCLFLSNAGVALVVLIVCLLAVAAAIECWVTPPMVTSVLEQVLSQPVLWQSFIEGTLVIPIAGIPENGQFGSFLYTLRRSLTMSPRQSTPKGRSDVNIPVKKGPGQDRDRQLEDARHHPVSQPLPHPEHKPIKKPVLPPKHTPHSHPHGDELPAHTNPPGPIKPEKKITLTGAKK